MKGKQAPLIHPPGSGASTQGLRPLLFCMSTRVSPLTSMKDGLAKSAGVIGAATLTSRILGLVRDQAQAYFFGTDWRADAFVVATSVPTLLR